MAIDARCASISTDTAGIDAVASTVAAVPADGFAAYERQHREFWDAFASRRPGWANLGGYYHYRLTQVYQWLVPPGLRVLEIGCGNGDLLASLRPSVGLGIDFSASILSEAAHRHPSIRFVQADAHQWVCDGPFDVIIVSDLVNDLWDVQMVLEGLRRACRPATRIILNTYSHLWHWPLRLAQCLGLARSKLQQNWLTNQDMANLLYLAGFEVVRCWQEILWPVRTPLWDSFCNRWLVKLWPLRHAALTNFIVARPQPGPSTDQAPTPPVVSVIVPARNEAGNIEAIVQRTPEMGAGTELVFVEGHSGDNTAEAIRQAIDRYPRRRCKSLTQSGAGKGDAVRLGFAEASGDVLMILDADLTVAPERLPLFYQALLSGKGEFINGVRLVYPMDKRAMRLLNLIGNKLFSASFSWLIGQNVKDTLCGTKVLWKRDYRQIAANRAHFGDFDPFGDFDLLFGAAKLNLKITDLPVRYRQRTYGATNIHRWKHGWLLVRMVLFAARRLKFV